MMQLQKLDKWAEKEFQRNIDNIIVFDNKDGYIAFGKYHLTPDSVGCSVTTFDQQKLYFSNKKTAISWCVADKCKMYSLANNILTLDQKKQLLVNDIECQHRQIANCKKFEFADTIRTKLQRKISQLTAINLELEKCLKTAKYYQIRGFFNETARTRVS